MSADESDEAELRDILLDKVPEEVADKILVHHTLTSVSQCTTPDNLCFCIFDAACPARCLTASFSS